MIATSLGARLARHWRSEVADLGNEARLLAAAAFFVAFVITRLVTHFLLASSGGGGIEVGGLHIHHMVFGLVLVLLSGVLDVGGVATRTRAVLFGAGAALVLDEFALILNLADVYWAPQGRESIDAIAIFGSALFVVVLGGGFWRRALREVVAGGEAVTRGR